MRLRWLLVPGLLVALGACDSLPPAPTSSAPTAPSGQPCGTSANPWGTPGCPDTGAPGARVAAPMPAAAPVPAQPRAAAPVPAPPLAPGATPSVVEVQVSGRVLPPRDAPSGQLLVALTDGPCFQPGTHYLTWAKAAPGGNFLLDIFPPVGTPLEACGAVVEPGKSRISWWGRADRGTMDVQGRGRIVYQGTDIPLRRGPDVPVPAGLGLTP